MGPHSSRASLANHVVSSLRELEEIHHRFEQFTNDLKSKRLAEDEILNTHAQNISASVESIRALLARHNSSQEEPLSTKNPHVNESNKGPCRVHLLEEATVLSSQPGPSSSIGTEPKSISSVHSPAIQGDTTSTSRGRNKQYTRDGPASATRLKKVFDRSPEQTPVKDRSGNLTWEDENGNLAPLVCKKCEKSGFKSVESFMNHYEDGHLVTLDSRKEAIHEGTRSMPSKKASARYRSIHTARKRKASLMVKHEEGTFDQDPEDEHLNHSQNSSQANGKRKVRRISSNTPRFAITQSSKAKSYSSQEKSAKALLDSTQSINSLSLTGKESVHSTETALMARNPKSRLFIPSNSESGSSELSSYLVDDRSAGRRNHEMMVEVPTSVSNPKTFLTPKLPVPSEGKIRKPIACPNCKGGEYMKFNSLVEHLVLKHDPQSRGRAWCKSLAKTYWDSFCGRKKIAVGQFILDKHDSSDTEEEISAAKATNKNVQLADPNSGIQLLRRKLEEARPTESPSGLFCADQRNNKQMNQDPDKNIAEETRS
ncbi:MAG: hypothetical protein M1824_003510 [Vezdaea acicularis]|nr:MAG: hypothetical protein M1824_003510 [Vezdaea acicularis]